MLDELFGNPADGTFAAWLVDGGLWAILIAAAGVFAWWFARRGLRRWVRQAISGLGQSDATADVDIAIQAADSRITSLAIALVIGFLSVLGILAALGNNVDPAAEFLRDTGASIGIWLGTAGLTIALIVFASWVATRIVRRIIPRVLSSIMLGQASTADHDEVLKRSETLSSVFVGAAVTLIYISALFMILTELSVPVGPVLGGFGIAGIAVGFGAQHLVRDLIAGVFILAGNQYRTGDVVTIAGISGLVESINLRRTVLRDLDGQVHVIPNGEITVASNKTKYWSRVNLDVGVAYKEDVDRVIKVLNEIGDDIAADPYFGLMLITPPQVLRLNSFDDSSVTFKVIGDCKPMKQWEIMGEMRRRIKIRFDQEGIEIPFPHQTIYWGEDQVPLQWDEVRMAGYGVETPAESEAAQIARSKEPAHTEPEVSTEPAELVPVEMTPELREELLANLALAAIARVTESDPDIRTRTRSTDTDE